MIDYQYGGGSSPAVLLVMDRLQRDLYAAIKTGLDWLARYEIFCYDTMINKTANFSHWAFPYHTDLRLITVQ